MYTTPTPTNFTQLVDVFIVLIQAALPVLAGLALLVFIWGLAKFIFKVGDDEKAVGDGKNLMKWGLIALFILVSFWAIIQVIHQDVGFGSTLYVPFLPEENP